MLTIEKGTKAFDYFKSKIGIRTVSPYDYDDIPTPTGSGIDRVVHRVEDSLVIEHIKYHTERRTNVLNVCFDEKDWMNRKRDIECNV